MASRSPTPGSVGTPAEKTVWLLVAVLCTVFIAHALFLTNGVLVDDAYIAIRYSIRLAAGQGLTFQDGPPVEGYTCFSWVLLGALLQKLGLAPAALLPLVGVCCGAAVVAVATRAAVRWQPPPASLGAGLLPGLFLVGSPGLAHYSGSGLETPLFVLLVLLALVASLDGHPVKAAVCGSLALLTRPEGVVVALLALLIGVARADAPARRRWYAAATVVALVGGAYATFKWAYFGALVPNTAVAKLPVFSRGLGYVAEQAVDAAPLLLLSTVAILRRPSALPRHAYCLLAAACLAIVTAVEGGDWMAGNRLLLPALVAAAPALGVVPQTLRLVKGGMRWALGALVTLAGAFYAYGSAYDGHLLRLEALHVAAYEPLRDDIAQRMVKSGVKSVATLDIGRISYAAPSLRLVDLGGLTDPEIARLPGGHHGKVIPAQLLEARSPDAFLLSGRSISPQSAGPPQVDFYYPAEAGVAGSSWFSQHYRLYTALRVRPNYFLCWYSAQ